MEDQNCDCCEGTQSLTPANEANRPGLSALNYRVGTHARFLETMKARLSNMAIGVSDPNDAARLVTTYPLGALTTRAGSDPGIALLDCWATIADVLSFYQERIANEGFLGTAIERRSVLELARMIGYTLRPGVSASVFLALELDKNHQVTIQPREIKAQTVPGPGELPQVFENDEALDARFTWNRLKPRQSQQQTVYSVLRNGRQEPERLYIKGISTNLKNNDAILLGEGLVLNVYHLDKVMPDPARDRTLVTFNPSNQYQKAAIVVASQPLDVRAVIEVAQSYIDVKPSADRSKARTEMAQRVIGQLTGLVSDLKSPNLSIEAATQSVHESLAKISEEQAMAVGEQYSKLAPWLGGMVEKLDAAHQGLQAIRASSLMLESAAAAAGGGSSAGQPGVIQNTDPLQQTLLGLVKTASQPPRNTLNLVRDLSSAFGNGADNGLQLGAIFDDRLARSLPAAMAGVRAAPDGNFHAYAFRAMARPFGYNAPLKPILNDAGLVIDHEEWPIAFSDSLGIKIRMWDVTGANATGRTGIGNITVEISSSHLGNTIRQVYGKDKLPLAGHVATVQFKNMDVTITAGRTMMYLPESYDFKFHEINYQVTFEVVDQSTDIKVTVVTPSSTVLDTVSMEQTARQTYGSRTVTIARSGFTISSLDETAQPPDPTNVIDLDGSYDQITTGSKVVILRADTNQQIITNVTQIQALSRADYGITGKSTRLTLTDDWLTNDDRLLSVMRATTILGQSEELPLAEAPLETPICGGDVWIELDGLYSGMKSGRWLIISGERTDINDAAGQVVRGIASSELVMLADVIQDVAGQDGQPFYYNQANNGNHNQVIDMPRYMLDDPKIPIVDNDKMHTWLRLAKKLEYCYLRDTTIIYANVVKASHGETRKETMGGGDASQAFQSFNLKQSPLTFTSSATPSGAESSLQVFVNDVRWFENDTLADLKPTDRKFVTKTDDNGKTAVTFGNGQSGARLPTAPGNVRAEYRNGIGRPGNVQAGKISLLMVRPLGVQSVNNPLRSSGGADPESRDTARKNAPRTVTALDRLVSVSDYADFARTYAGIAKSTAARVVYQKREVVQVTIAGADDMPIDSSSDLFRNLLLALRGSGDPHLPIILQTRFLFLLFIGADVRILKEYQWEPVVKMVRAKLLDTFSFERRELGQDLVLSEVIAAVQAVPGVDYVDVNFLGYVPEKSYTSNRPPTPNEISNIVRGQISPMMEIRGLSGVIPEVPGANGSARQSLTQQPIQRIPFSRFPQLLSSRLAGAVLVPAAFAYLSPQSPDMLVLNQVK